MELSQIETTLQETFNSPARNGGKRKIIFWSDQKQEFADDWNLISLENVELKELTDKNQFSTKYLLELEDTSSNYLIYSNIDLYSSDNWLLDTVLYSEVFTADRLNLIMNELKIPANLKSTIEKYKSFFDNKRRYQKLSNYEIENYTIESIEVGIISVLCNLKVPNFDIALRTILMEGLEDDSNKYLIDISKYFDIDRFWEIIEVKFTYNREIKILKTLFMHLVVTALSINLDEVYLSRISNFIAKSNRNNSYIFIDHWMGDKTDSRIFDEYIVSIENELGLEDILQEIPVDAYKEAEIFPAIDRKIIQHIADSLIDELNQYDFYLDLINIRRPKHYFENYEAIYNVLYYTIKIEQFEQKYQPNIPSDTTENIFKAYEYEYYLMDTYYRKFYLSYDLCEKYDFIDKLEEKVDYTYKNWFMGELNAHWVSGVKKELVNEWKLPDVKNQKDFYFDNVKFRVDKDERIFIIISDAMRYEIAVELAEKLNMKTAGSTIIEPMLGVIPTITKYGMAALLPHKTLDINESGKAIVDGKPIEGYTQRKQFIEAKIQDSIVVDFDEFSQMNTSRKKDVFKGKKLIYIYHDKLDSIGDNASSENRVFEAAEDTITDMLGIVKSILNDLSGTNIFITADHGFLYQRSSLDESDKVVNELKNPIESKKRYALSTSTQELSGQTRVELSKVLDNDNAINVYVPNGVIRNRVQGPGSNFVHGGASLQEIMVPLITFKNRREGQRHFKGLTKVQVVYTGQTNRITNRLFTLQFFQNEKVEDKYIPVTVEAYFEDEESNIISNVETIIADVTSDNPDDRVFPVNFALETMQFSRDKNYYLTIKDTETDQKTSRTLFEINLGITNDFGF